MTARPWAQLIAPLLAALLTSLLTAGPTPWAPTARAGEPRPTRPALPSDTPLPDEMKARIEQGEAAFRIQNYERVVQILDRLAGHPLLEGRAEHVRVLEMLGSSHWFMIAPDSARLVFGQLLRESPFHRLDGFVYPAELIAFFETRRKELVTAGIIPAKPGESDGFATRRVLVREVNREDAPGVIYLMPFGVGQFVNDESGKGAAMAVIQGLGAATMLASWIAIETMKVDDTNRILPEDGGQARLLNALWYGGMTVFTATWAFSIIDGFANRNTEPTIRERYELLEPNPRPGPSARLLPGLGGATLDVRF